MAQIELQLADGTKAFNNLKELNQEVTRLANNVKKAQFGSEEYIRASADFKKVKGSLEEVRKEAFAVEKAQAGVLGELKKMIPYGDQIGAFGGKMKMVTTAVGGTTKGFQMLKVAIASTGIGALVVVLGSLISYLTTTQEGMDKLARVMMPLKAIFEGLKGVAQELGGQVFKTLAAAIKDPMQAFKDLGSAIQENVMNRLKALGQLGPAIAKIFSKDWKEGLKDLGNATIQLATGVTEGIDKMQNAARGARDWVKGAAEAGKIIFELQKQIEEQEIKLVKNRELLNLKIEESKEIAKDLTKTEEERLAAAREAYNAQNQLLAMEQQFIDLKIRKMQEEQKLNDTSREGQLELARLEAERTRFMADAARKRTEARVLENRITKQADAERAREQTKLEKEQKDERDRMAKEETERRKAELAEIEAERKRVYETSNFEAQMRYEEQQVALELARANQLMTEEQYQQAIVEMERQYMEERLQAIIVFYGEASNEARKAQSQLALYNAKAYAREQETMRKSQEAQTDVFATEMSKRTGAADRFFGDLGSLFEEGTAEAQAAATLQGSMAAIESSINAFNWGVKIGGPVLAAVLASAAFAAQMSRVTRIKQSPTRAARGMYVPQYGYGGLLDGPRHSQGGIPGVIRATGQPIEMEGGEIILTRAVGLDPMARRLASDLNARYGGVRFETGGPVPGSTSAAGGDASVMAAGQSNAQLIEEVRQLRAALASWPERLKVINVVSETRNGIDVLNRLEERAAF